MGIRYLSSFIKKKCANAINKVHLREMRGKRIVIDASIYMYRFEADGNLIHNMQKFATTLKKYGIQPMFVFDGIPPSEKLNTINTRREQRELAVVEYSTLVSKLQEDELSKNEREEIIKQCNIAKRTAAKITPEKVDAIKSMFTTQHIDYCIAPNEADLLCASMVLYNHTRYWGCMSDDTDMFVYGCENIIRDFDMDTETVSIYTLNDILEKMNISHEDFKRLCILAGTDYETHTSNNIPFYTIVNLFNRFRKKTKYDNLTFYNWLTYYIKMNIDHEALEKIYKIYTPSNKNNYITYLPR